MGERTALKIWYLKNLRLLSGMPEAFIAELERITRMEEVGPRALVYTPAEAREKVYLLKKGEVQIYRVANGRRVVIDALRPGDLFGDLHPAPSENAASLVAPSDHAENFAKTEVGCTICILRKADFFELLRRYPSMSLRIIEELARRLNETEAKVRDLALHRVLVRVVHELIRLAQREGSPADGDVFVIPHRPRHEELADRVGTSRETVTRVLSLLKEQGALEEDKDVLRILKSRVALEER